MFGYALLGAGWLIIKTSGDLRAMGAPPGTPLPDRCDRRRGYRQPVDAAGRPADLCALVQLAQLPAARSATADHRLLAVYEWRLLHRGPDHAPYFVALALFLLAYLGIAISLWPMIVPHHFTLREAAASPSTQAFLLIGTLFLLPVILMYSAWSYWVFRGKVRGDIGYH